MKTTAGAALLFVGLIASLIGAPSAVAGPELDFCRDMAAVGYPGDCATLVGLARDVCAQYDRGLDWQTVLQGLDRATKDESLSNYIMAGAPLYFCPEHHDKT
jgi:Protein of unknown function (DUF732)